jgi:hypothetical protein
MSNGTSYCDWEINAYTSSVWTHLAWVFAGQNKPEVYVNGSPASLVVGGSCSIPGAAIVSGYQFSMGGYQAEGGLTIDGLLRSIRVSSVGRYSSAFVPQTSFAADASTQALYQLDEGQGVNAADSSTSARNATLSSASWASDCP